LPDLEKLAEVVPAGCADARAVWAALGAAGAVAEVAGAARAVPPDVRPLGDLLGWLDARVPAGVTLSVCVQIATVVPLLRRLGAHEVLQEAEEGRTTVALAVTDRPPGSDVLAAETRLRAAGAARARLTGHKRWVTNALTADHLLVLARHDDRRHFTSFSWALVPADRPGVSVRPRAPELVPGAGLGDVVLDDVELAPGHLVGRRGRALADFAAQVTIERVASALWARAFARRFLLLTRERLRGPRWENAAIRARFARCLVAWGALDALCRARPGESPAYASLVKAHSGSALPEIVRECASLLGADALDDETGMVAALGQAQIFDIAGGATGVLLDIVADHAGELLGER
jgi:alkylation response protein AidB-like acyl-CoA dehydrogenase